MAAEGNGDPAAPVDTPREIARCNDVPRSELHGEDQEGATRYAKRGSGSDLREKNIIDTLIYCIITLGHQILQAKLNFNWTLNVIV